MLLLVMTELHADGGSHTAQCPLVIAPYGFVREKPDDLYFCSVGNAVMMLAFRLSLLKEPI